eukprot:m.266397 g.266397  ORF g.266397 m.266397 type:complete len:105 (+) comp40500_c0_seq21:96-410(+)
MLPCYCKAYFPVRFVLAIMASLGLANMFALRVNLSVAIVHMKKELGWNSETSGECLLSSIFSCLAISNQALSCPRSTMAISLRNFQPECWLAASAPNWFSFQAF